MDRVSGQQDDANKEATQPAIQEPLVVASNNAQAAAAAEVSPPAPDALKSETSRFSLRDTLMAMAAPLMARPRLSRVTVLTLAIALSAAAGSAVGAMAAAVFAKPQPAMSEDARTIEVKALQGMIENLSAEVAALKASIASNAKTANAQMAKIADRVEKAQAEPASRVAKLSELMERLDKRTAPATIPAAPDVTGSIAPKIQERPQVVSGWVLHEVYGGRAMVENNRFGLYEAVPGANLPGLGRVETIRRQDGRWVVVTPKGLITSGR